MDQTHKLTGTTRRDVVREIEDGLGADGSRAIAERMYDLLGGSYDPEERACAVEYTSGEWDRALVDAAQAEDDAKRA